DGGGDGGGPDADRDRRGDGDRVPRGGLDPQVGRERARDDDGGGDLGGGRGRVGVRDRGVHGGGDGHAGVVGDPRSRGEGGEPRGAARGGLRGAQARTPS